jgi:hypothetical protein
MIRRLYKPDFAQDRQLCILSNQCAVQKRSFTSQISVGAGTASPAPIEHGFNSAVINRVSCELTVRRLRLIMTARPGPDGQLQSPRWWMKLSPV